MAYLFSHVYSIMYICTECTRNIFSTINKHTSLSTKTPKNLEALPAFYFYIFFLILQRNHSIKKTYEKWSKGQTCTSPWAKHVRLSSFNFWPSDKRVWLEYGKSGFKLTLLSQRLSFFSSHLLKLFKAVPYQIQKYRNTACNSYCLNLNVQTCSRAICPWNRSDHKKE